MALALSRTTFWKNTILVSSCLLLGLTTGCADLKAIQDFASISAESAEYTQLVDNYLTFPDRQKRYQASNRHQQLDQMARARAEQKKALLLRHEMIEEYMEALGRLAADEIVDHTEEISKLSQAVQEGVGTGPEETKAFGKMASLLTKVASNKWRQGKLQTLIEESNAPLQVVLGTLQKIVNEGFRGDGQTEQAALRNYYTTIIMESNDPAGKAALKEWQELRIAQSSERMEGIQTYSQLLQEISKGHQQLYDQRNDLNPQVLRQLQKSVEEMRELLALVKTI